MNGGNVIDLAAARAKREAAVRERQTALFIGGAIAAGAVVLMFSYALRRGPWWPTTPPRPQ